MKKNCKLGSNVAMKLYKDFLTLIIVKEKSVQVFFLTKKVVSIIYRIM